MIVIGMLLGISVQFVVAWKEPSQDPPDGNLGAPISVGNIHQYKKGSLGVNVDNIDAVGLLNKGTHISMGSVWSGDTLWAFKDAIVKDDIYAHKM